MASPSPIDQTLILLVLLLLPFNLFSFVHRSIRRTDGRGGRYFRSAIISALLISLSAILALSERDPSPSKHPSSDLEEMKVQITKLESLLEEKNMLLNSRILEIERSKKMIEEMDKKIEFLQKALNDVKVSYDVPLVSDEKIKAMSDEVQQLWDESRRNNFNIHVSESKTWEAEKRVEELASKVEQLRRSIARHAHSKTVGLPDSFFLGGSISRASLLKANNQLKGMISATKKKHHELQCTVKQAMEMNEYTAPLAHREFVFFVASAIIVFPLMMAWVLCSSIVD